MLFSITQSRGLSFSAGRWQGIINAMKNAWIVLAAVCALSLGLYACAVHSGAMESLRQNAAETYYNLLVQGLRSGQLNLKEEVPPGLAQLADPYDPTANAPYRLTPYWLHDLSYYKGKLYLYFGITPALILFWPFAALTGHYLFHRQAVMIFCTIGFLASVSLLYELWHRYFAEVSVWVVAACALALGLATLVPVLLSQSDVYEVAISCGYAFTMLALMAIWAAMHEPEPRKSSGWLAAASVAYGLAVGARPSLLFGAVILLVPVAETWRERRQVWMVLLAAIGPLVFIGLGLMLYNFLRFDSPLEFGRRYQLAAARQDMTHHFSLYYLWFNFRVYFLQAARWGTHFPFVRNIAVPPSPAGYGLVESPFGALTNIPLVWLALAAPLAWYRRPAEERHILFGFLSAAALLFGICALTISLYDWASVRYEADFLPTLVLLAVIGILGAERALTPTSESGKADPTTAWRRAARWGWGLLLGFSVVFNLLAGVEHYAETDNDVGIALEEAGRVPEATGYLEQALLIRPEFAEARNNLGVVLTRAGKLQEAIGQFRQALQIDPNYAEAHLNLGLALAQLGRVPEAQGQWEQALRIKPDYPEAHCALGIALEQAGKREEAIAHYDQAVQIKPDFAAASNALMRLRAVPISR